MKRDMRIILMERPGVSTSLFLARLLWGHIGIKTTQTYSLCSDLLYILQKKMRQTVLHLLVLLRYLNNQSKLH
jgi:hypothetical protein